MADGATQSPAGRRVYVGGHLVGGRAKGVYCSVAPAQRHSKSVGVDGSGTFIDNGDNSATITIRLNPESESNTVLSAFYATNTVYPVVVEEQNGTTAGGTPRAKITKLADVEWSDGTEVRVWVLECTNWTGVVGGIAASPIGTVDESTL